MSKPCPFCGFESSDFRESFNWRCSRCGEDYANWLMSQKQESDSNTGEPAERAAKKPVFSRRETPPEAEPVKFAQSLFVLVILALAGLNFVVDGIFAWVYPVAIPLAGYHAFTVYSTGYALGQYSVYSRRDNPIMFNVHLWGWHFWPGWAGE